MTQIKILIKTPKGYAKKTEYQLRPFLIGRNGKLHKILTNEVNDKILWIVEAEPRQYTKIIRNVNAYALLIRKIISNKILRRAAKLSKDGEAELESMLIDQTEIDVVKENELPDIMKEFKEV